MKELKNGLITQNYTKVLEEEDYSFNAPCLFKVVRVDDNSPLAEIHFQEGAIKENGINGVNNEDLIAMVIRRLQGFQNSEFSCRENAIAITKLEETLMWLRKLTNDRETRGIIGTHVV